MNFLTCAEAFRENNVFGPQTNYSFYLNINQERAEEVCKMATNFDFLHVPVVQLRANILSVTLRRTGCGSSVKLVDFITWREAQ